MCSRASVGPEKGSPPPTLPGTVVECEPGPDGHVDLDGYIDVEDPNHEVWRVLYGLSGATAPGLTTRMGARVTLRFDAHWGFSRAAGFMLLDEAGPVIAVERGTFGHGLVPENRRPFAINLGEAIARRTDGCGDALAHALQITGDTQVRILPGREGAVSLHGAGYRFWSAEVHDLGKRALHRHARSDLLGPLASMIAALEHLRPSSRTARRSRFRR